MTELQIGQPAPTFSLETDSIGQFDLAEQRGKKVLLFFYPKDNTEGCTIENIDFTALKDDFEKLNTVLVGISADSLKKHANFRKKYELDVILVSDPERVAIESYGVWVEKKMYGKTFHGIERTTYLIDENGDIAHIWRKVKARGHAQEVLQHLSQNSE